MHNQDDKIAFIDKDKAPKKKKKRKKKLVCYAIIYYKRFAFFFSFAPLKGIDIHTDVWTHES